jgi:lysophosphatidate acyltransferase
MDTPIEHLDLSSPESASLAFTIWSWVFKFFALYIGLTTSLYTMSLMGNTTASFFARCLTAYIMLMLCALYGVFASIILRLVGMHRMSQWVVARAYKWTMRFTTRVRFEVIAGKEHLKERPVVFVGNHQTALDVLLLATIFPRWCSVTAKKQLKAMPFLGWFMAVSGTVFIVRGNRATALKAFEGAAKEITTKRQSVFIFPEGTRSNTDEPVLLPFKKGAFHLAVQAGVPIVPVVAANYSGVLSLKAWRFRAGVIPVIGRSFEPPFQVPGMLTLNSS